MSAKDKTLTVNKLKVNIPIPIELESEFILRLPEEPAQELRKVLRSHANTENRLTIQVENDMRHATVRFDNWSFPAKFEDLPCILESLKTIDKKTFYKTADISQILLCKLESDDQDESPKKTETFLHPHGITKPLKNVRKRLQRLLRVDNEAVSVRWEVVTDEEPAVDSKRKKNPTELDIFGEVSSSEDEDINIMDSTDEDDEDSCSLPVGSVFQEAEVDLIEDNQEMEVVEDVEVDDVAFASMKRCQEIRQQLAIVQAKRNTQESVIRSVKNQALKQRFLEIINKLNEEEKELKIQYKEFE
uniref:TAFII55 protein conserved region domain-containing protein n=1 Tax=Strigamia maritima TaxID=126957 RepID=T1J637_STRMM